MVKYQTVEIEVLRIDDEDILTGSVESNEETTSDIFFG